MQDIKYLESLGATAAEFKKKFTAKKLDDKIKKLIELHSNRIRNGIETCISEAPIWGAIDRSLEAAAQNLHSIQARELAERGQKAADIITNLKSADLDWMLSTVIDETTGKPLPNPQNPREPMLVFNQPIFDKVFVPVVFAYCELIIAKICNDSNGYPYYPYAPARLDEVTRLAAHIITDRVQRMKDEMGYVSDEEQSIRNMVYYGQAFNFPKESYYRQQYKTKEGDKVVTKTEREGVRFVVPHPRRTFWDRSCPLYTFNSDTGVEYAGYWDISKTSKIKGNSAFWNTDKLTLGGYDPFLTTSAGWRLWQQFYPCQIVFPTGFEELRSSGKWDRIDRETSAFLLKDEGDVSSVLAVKNHKLIPSEWGLFDYDHPTWMRFVYGGIDTNIFCEVMPYTPGCVYLDKYDANKTIASSIGLQLLPWQQLLGNFLTQHFSAVRQNLVRIYLYNKDMGLPDMQALIQKQGDKLYQRPILVPFSKSRDVPFGQNDKSDVITRLELPQMSTADLKSNVELVMLTLERVLGFSANMVGAPASHEQSAAEIRTLNFNSSIAVEKTKSGRDIAVAAKKRILYTAFYCYGDDEIIAEVVGPLTKESRAALTKLGFSIEGDSKDGDMRYTVKGKKQALTPESFVATSREGVTRLDDSKLGISILQFLGQIVGGPLVQLFGPARIERMLYYTVRMLFPSDFASQFEPGKTPPGQQPQQEQEQLMALLAKAQEATVNKAVQTMNAELSQELLPQLAKAFAEMRQMIESLAKSDAQQNMVLQEKVLPAVQVVEHTIQERLAAMQQPPPMPPPGMPPPVMA